MGRQLCKEDETILKVIKDKMTVENFTDFYLNSRPLDLLEAELMHDKKFGDLPIEDFTDAWVLRDEDKVYAIGRIEDHVVWMMCTKAVEENPVKFLRFIRRYYRDTISEHKMLWNYALKDNELHINWLKWLGATFHDEIDVKGKTFVRFIFRRKEDR